MREARTITEAYLHISLTVAHAGPGKKPDYRPWTVFTEGPDAWKMVFDHFGHYIELRVPYATEYTARCDGLHFGPGISTLVDAGQWVLTAAAYARMAVEDDLLSSPDALLGWEIARDAAVEAAKFLPDDADEMPLTAFWTPLGTATHRQEPERFTRERLRGDIEFYQQNMGRLRAG
ncbi:hypothetical protein [Nonomuraea recticatena]|uniref:Uncharacterized protein n=1 Tax=Nonomuraea recticatena TaxID=46178 RepID=A0ABP6FVD6_9ACTN